MNTLKNIILFQRTLILSISTPFEKMCRTDVIELLDNFWYNIIFTLFRLFENIEKRTQGILSLPNKEVLDYKVFSKAIGQQITEK